MMSQSFGVSPRLVAQFFLARAMSAGEPVTHLKLQKLVYYAYAHTLVRTGRQLFVEPILAWKHGPVVEHLYHELKQYGCDPIEFAQIPAEVLPILDSVCEWYMPLSAWTLSQSTHQELPWQKAREGAGPDDSGEYHISDQDILEEFGKDKLVGKALKQKMLTNSEFIAGALRGLEEAAAGKLHRLEDVKRALVGR